MTGGVFTANARMAYTITCYANLVPLVMDLRTTLR